MRVFKYVLVFAVSFILVSPSAAANMVFNNEYERKSMEAYIASEGGDVAELNVFDLINVNNINSTIRPFMEDNNFSGIVQGVLGFPSVVGVNRTVGSIPVYGENISLSWIFVPEKDILFDSFSELWFRLPLNNISLGANDTTEIRLTVNHLLSFGYNITSGESYDNLTFDFGAHGSTYHSLVSDEILYSSSGVNSNITGYVLQDNRTIYWNTTKSNVTTMQQIDYNFTWLKYSNVLYRKNTYLFTVSLNTRNVTLDKPGYEFLFSSGDFNDDLFLMSHFYLDNTSYNITCDFDAPVIVSSMASGGAYGLGFFNSTEEKEFLFAVDHRESYTVAKNITVQLPVFSTGAFNVSVALGISDETTLEGYTLSSYQTVSLRPGTNVISISENFAVAYTMERFFVSVIVQAANTSQLGFWVCSNNNESGYSTVRTNDTWANISFNSVNTVMLRYKVSTSVLGYFPLDQYLLIVVPDPENMTMLHEYRKFYTYINRQLVTITDSETGEDKTFLVDLTVLAIGTLTMVGVIVGAPVILLVGGAAIVGVYVLNKLGVGDYIADQMKEIFKVVWAKIGYVVKAVGSFLWGIIEFVVNALSWLMGFAIQFAAVFFIVAVYFFTSYANGLASSVVDAVKAKRRDDMGVNLDVLREGIESTWATTRQVLSITMGFGSFLFGLLLVVLKLVFPLA